GGRRAQRELKDLSTSWNRKHSPSSGERNGKSPNLFRVIAGRRCGRGVVRRDSGSADPRRSPKSRSVAEGAWNGPPETVIARCAKSVSLGSQSSSTTRKVS